MRAVNLLPKETKRERKATPIIPLVAVVGLVLVTAITALMFMSKSSEVSQAQTQLDLANAELASIPPPPPVDAAQPELRQAQSSRLTALSAALGQRVSWDRLLRHFSQVLPDDVWLTSLQARTPGATTGTSTGGGFVLQGLSYSHESVARLLARLQVVPDLTNVALQTSVAQPDAQAGGRTIVQFTVVADVRVPGAAS
jgi:Tfp pilus assembly protein PilN